MKGAGRTPSPPPPSRSPGQDSFGRPSDPNPRFAPCPGGGCITPNPGTQATPGHRPPPRPGRARSGVAIGGNPAAVGQHRPQRACLLETRSRRGQSSSVGQSSPSVCQSGHYSCRSLKCAATRAQARTRPPATRRVFLSQSEALAGGVSSQDHAQRARNKSRAGWGASITAQRPSQERSQQSTGRLVVRPPLLAPPTPARLWSTARIRPRIARLIGWIQMKRGGRQCGTV